MKPDLTEIVCILDRSGSMAGLATDAIGGYNSFIERQKELPGEAHVTVVLFDDNYDIIYNCVNIHDMPKLNSKIYYARGSTALLDAVGKTIDSVGVRLHNTKEEERPSKVIFVIITDGQENASLEYTYDRVRAMIKLQKETYNWEFLFLASDIHAVDYGASLGVQNAVMYSNTQVGTQSSYVSASMAVGNLRLTGNVDDGEDWKAEIK